MSVTSLTLAPTSALLMASYASSGSRKKSPEMVAAVIVSPSSVMSATTSLPPVTLSAKWCLFMYATITG